MAAFVEPDKSHNQTESSQIAPDVPSRIRPHYFSHRRTAERSRSATLWPKARLCRHHIQSVGQFRRCAASCWVCNAPSPQQSLHPQRHHEHKPWIHRTACSWLCPCLLTAWSGESLFFRPTSQVLHTRHSGRDGLPPFSRKSLPRVRMSHETSCLQGTQRSSA